jgi:hypothetical protein
MKKLISILALTLLGGCATDKEYYAAIQARIAADQATQVAKSEADKARYQALVSMANSGGDSAKVAAVFALMSNSTSNQVSAPAAAIQPAPTPVDRVLQVLQVTNSIVTPWIAPVMSYKNAQISGQVAIAQSQSNRDIFLGSYNAIAQVAGNIPQPTTTTTTTTNTDASNRSTTTDASNRSTTTDASNRSTTTTDSSNRSTTTTNSIGRDGVNGSGTLTRNCTSGNGSQGSSGSLGGTIALSPSIPASGVMGNTNLTTGSGGAGGAGGPGGGLNC